MSIILNGSATGETETSTTIIDDHSLDNHSLDELAARSGANTPFIPPDLVPGIFSMKNTLLKSHGRPPW
jgi:hypothetical protein